MKRPLGKDAALVVEKVLLAPSGLAHGELAARLGRDTRDGRHKLKTRRIAPLVEGGLLVERDGVYDAPGDLAERLDAELEATGCFEAHRLQEARYERARRAYREKLRGEEGGTNAWVPWSFTLATASPGHHQDRRWAQLVEYLGGAA